MASGSGVELVRGLGLPGVRLADEGDGVVSDLGVVTAKDGAGFAEACASAFAEALAAHRRWTRATDGVAA